MSAGYRADLPALTTLVERMDAFARAAEDLADELACAARRLGGHWSGAAADAHAAAQRRWLAAHDLVRADAGHLAHRVRAAHANYTAAADANSRMWA